MRKKKLEYGLYLSALYKKTEFYSDAELKLTGSFDNMGLLGRGNKSYLHFSFSENYPATVMVQYNLEKWFNSEDAMKAFERVVLDEVQSEFGDKVYMSGIARYSPFFEVWLKINTYQETLAPDYDISETIRTGLEWAEDLDSIVKGVRDGMPAKGKKRNL